MLTKWAKELLTPSLSEYILPAIANSGVGRKAYVTAKTILNNDCYTCAFSSSHVTDFRCITPVENSYSGVWVGTGDDPATENDYFLENAITSGLTGTVNRANLYDSENNSIGVRLTITITNSGTEEVTINEIGFSILLSSASAIGRDVTSSNKQCLIDRSILDSSVAIPAGEAGVIFYDFIYYDGSSEVVTTAKKA